MTDDDIEIFLSLKYSSMYECLWAFKQAIGYPDYELPYSVPEKVVMEGLKQWVEAGARKKMEIPPEQTEFFLKVKFGSIQNAYDYWIDCGPNLENFLNENELKVVMDYTCPASKKRQT